MTDQKIKLKDISPDELVIKLKKLIKKIELTQKQVYHQSITPAQVRVIFPIFKTGRGYSMQELSEIGGIDKALVSRVVADLEKKDIVRRDNKKFDVAERNCKILLTTKGEQINKNLKQNFAKVRESFGICNITRSEMEQFVNILNVLIGDDIENKKDI